jgi:hypothetical protein
MLRRRITGTVCSVALATLAVVVFPGIAAATAPAATSPAPSSIASADPGGYPAQRPLLTVSSGSVQLGGSVVVTGHGFQAGEGVDLSVTYAPANHALGSGGPVAQPAAFTVRHDVGRTASAVHALAASNGDFSTHVPLTQAGKATITATGEKSHLSLAATVSVLPAPSVSGSKSTQSTKQSPAFASIELLIGALAIAVLLFVGVTAWQRRSRKPSAEFDVSTT